ncbi:MAG: RsmB/NOP family class I SAM-dependent RNA methyltransferase [Bdellovibrionales bacterium]|nr:RsmB/NOP family class I SAM-dependent RNA methyltransferase [Bdellovibrionales bacterium]
MILERYRSVVDDWAAFEDVSRRPLPRCLWANPVRIDRDALRARLDRAGLGTRPLPWDPLALVAPAESENVGKRLEYLTGLYHLQEAVSILPALLLDARPGERILDLCAAPGNKTIRMAVAMRGSGTLVANDRGERRLSLIRGALDRMGITNVSLTDWNAAAYPSEAGLFDAVLADVPCSCEGTSRKNPLAAEWQEEGFRARLARLQEQILVRAAYLCRAGGRIVYSTCTYAPEENEAVVNAVLKRFHPGTLKVREVSVPGLRAAPGLTEWNGERFAHELRNCLRVWPHHQDTGGFFVAVIDKARDTEWRKENRAHDGALSAEPPDSKATEVARGLLHRYGIESMPEGLRWVRANTRYLHAVSRDHRPVAAPETVSAGIAAFRIKASMPMISAGFAIVMAPGITRGFADLDAEQAARFTRREPVKLEASQFTGPARSGVILARHEGFALGTGVYRERLGELESYFPKAWMRGSTAP